MQNFALKLIAVMSAWSDHGFLGGYYNFLKVLSATLLLDCFLNPNESTCESRKNVFYFTSKAVLILEKIKCQNLRFSDFMTSSNA